METAAPQPTEEYLALGALLERGRGFVQASIVWVEGVLARLGSAPLSAKLAGRLTRVALIPAELALRRVILILAADLPVPVLRASAPRAAPEAAALQSEAAPPRAAKRRPPAFSMRDPRPRSKTRRKANDPPEVKLARMLAMIQALRSAPKAPPRPAPRPGDAAAVFCRRFAALQAAFANPQREAGRWARRRIREMARPGAVQRSLPVPLTLPPLKKSVNPHGRNLLRKLTETTNTLFCHNTS